MPPGRKGTLARLVALCRAKFGTGPASDRGNKGPSVRGFDQSHLQLGR